MWQGICAGQLAACLPKRSIDLGQSGFFRQKQQPLADQTNTFALNSNNPSDNVNVAFNPTTTATLSLTNQQYSSSNYTTTGAPGGNAMVFGGEGNNNSDQVAAATIYYVPLNTKVSPPDSVFTATVNTPAGQGISGANNYFLGAIHLAASVIWLN